MKFLGVFTWLITLSSILNNNDYVFFYLLHECHFFYIFFAVDVTQWKKYFL